MRGYLSVFCPGTMLIPFEFGDIGIGEFLGGDAEGFHGIEPIQEHVGM